MRAILFYRCHCIEILTDIFLFKTFQHPFHICQQQLNNHVINSFNLIIIIVLVLDTKVFVLILFLLYTRSSMLRLNNPVVRYLWYKTIKWHFTEKLSYFELILIILIALEFFIKIYKHFIPVRFFLIITKINVKFTRRINILSFYYFCGMLAFNIAYSNK